MTVFEHMLANDGRLPRLGDPTPPWQYRGFLIPYIDHTPRWRYYHAVLALTNRLPDEPIPRLDFSAEPDRAVSGCIEQWCRIIGSGWSDFRHLLEWLGYALGLLPTLIDLKPAQHEALYRQVNLGRFYARPRDYLGQWICETRAQGGWNPNAFFPTPHDVVELMVAMTMHDEAAAGEDLRLRTVLDPCAGTGRMLLHASNHSLRLYGTDIDPLLVLACRINGALYAPWMSYRLPAWIDALPSAAPEVAPERENRPSVWD